MSIKSDQAAQQKRPKASSDAASGCDHPAGVRVGKLDTLPQVREEMGKLYRAARRSAGPSPTPAEASRLGFLLHHIGQTLVSVELAARIEALEQRWSDR